MINTRYINTINQVSSLKEYNRKKLSKVTKEFAFRSNTYYLSLINWDDPNDPIRKIVIPDEKELDDWGVLDPSEEELYTVGPGIQHKYTSTALLLVNNVCASYCRFCFRKRLFMEDNKEADPDISEGISYIKNHPEITNVLITGGEPFIFSTNKLNSILSRVSEIPHVRIIRLGTKMPAFNPLRVTKDPSFIDMLSAHIYGDKKIYCMLHFNHPRELTKEAIDAINLLQKAGIILTNQTPLLKGVNDNPKTLSELLNTLSYIGVAPYYVFIVRPTLGNKLYCLPIEKTINIYGEAVKQCSGLAKRSKLVMSHKTGKYEVVGKLNGYVYFRHYRSTHQNSASQLTMYKSNPQAYWLEDYTGALPHKSNDLVHTVANFV